MKLINKALKKTSKLIKIYLNKPYNFFEIIIWVIGIFLLILFFIVSRKNMCRWKLISEIFYNLTVGIGAIMAGLTGLVAIFKYFSSKKEEKKEQKEKEEKKEQKEKEERKREDLIDIYKQQYPVDKINKDFKLVFSPISGQPDRVYILNTKNNMRHWIASRYTFRDLGFDWAKVEKIKKTEDIQKFKKYEEGEDILTDMTKK